MRASNLGYKPPLRNQQTVNACNRQKTAKSWTAYMNVFYVLVAQRVALAIGGIRIATSGLQFCYTPIVGLLIAAMNLLVIAWMIWKIRSNFIAATRL